MSRESQRLEQEFVEAMEAIPDDVQPPDRLTAAGVMLIASATAAIAIQLCKLREAIEERFPAPPQKDG